MRSVVGSLSNAFYVLSVQVVALLALDPASFGIFSVTYLGFALSSSLAMSLISEAWLRRHSEEGVWGKWREYGAVTLYLCLFAGLAGLLVFLLVPILRDVALLGAISVAASTYRASARYFVVSTRGAIAGVPGDVAGIAVFFAGFVMSSLYLNSNLHAVMVAWMSGSIATVLAAGRPSFAGPSVLIHWVHRYGRQMRALTGDSLLSNISAIGTPILIAPLLGIASFGLYRALGSIAAPMRLLIVPLAPQIARQPLASHFTIRRSLVYLGLSGSFGIGAATILLVIQFAEIELGVIGPLSAYWPAAAIFIAANFFGHLTSIIARAWVPTKRLLVYRGWHAALGFVFPLCGAIFWGLTGAIWGLTASIVVASTFWIVALYSVSRRSG